MGRKTFLLRAFLPPFCAIFLGFLPHKKRIFACKNFFGWFFLCIFTIYLWLFLLILFFVLYCFKALYVVKLYYYT